MESLLEWWMKSRVGWDYNVLVYSTTSETFRLYTIIII